MSLSEKQLAANRANAQFAKGPTSIEGRRKSSQNARRHGITAQTTVMTEEDRIKHDDFCAKMMADLAPVGPLETFHASSVAEEAWRLNDCRAQCNNIVAIGHFDGTGDNFETEHPEIDTAITAAATVRANAKTLELLSLYAQRIHRAFEKHYEQLRRLQAEREARRKADLEAARLLAQVAELKNTPFDPVADGFDFSPLEITRYTDRFHRLVLAEEENLAYRKHVNLWVVPKAA